MRIHALLVKIIYLTFQNYSISSIIKEENTYFSLSHLISGEFGSMYICDVWCVVCGFDAYACMCCAVVIHAWVCVYMYVWCVHSNTAVCVWCGCLCVFSSYFYWRFWPVFTCSTHRWNNMLSPVSFLILIGFPRVWKNVHLLPWNR